MLVGTSAEITDRVFSESNTAVRRPLPLWPYASSYNVSRARNTYPQKMAINQCMSFIDYPWRFATVPQNEIRIRLWQNVAHGGAAALNMHGTMEQEDRMALEAARPIYRLAARTPGLLRRTAERGARSAAGRTWDACASDSSCGACSAFSRKSTSPSASSTTWTGSASARSIW